MEGISSGESRFIWENKSELRKWFSILKPDFVTNFSKGYQRLGNMFILLESWETVAFQVRVDFRAKFAEYRLPAGLYEHSSWKLDSYN
jgi:hypothetical protein